MAKIIDTDYLFLSTRVKALERNLLARERMERMLEGRTAEDAAAARQAIPRLRELFRRERSAVPVELKLRLEEGGARLTARDELSDAEEAVQSAAINLFSAYNTYCWAVQNGILN